ncbi:matrix-remodeling-associated protein 7 isoform X1 [Brachionichthys hirsutus]|uniref:matrix-remodeling-associated protein 7 isoform X1 n=1 Tax=Brachionichthys hirsutus TaxID=412623 RepID=UPI00360456D8
MDLTLVLSAAIFTLLALVVATSLLNGYPSSRSTPESRSEPAPKQNGHVPEKEKEEEEAAGDAWCDISGSGHDHWDVVKSVQSEEEHPHPKSGDLDALLELSSTTTATSFEVDPPSPEASTARGRGSYIGLSDKELLKFAFRAPQTGGAAESPEVQEKVEPNETSALKYVPGKARSHHLEMMMSKEELEEEQRVQREQLAVIFQLLQDNKETFGELSDGDVEEQLRLYSI